MNLEQLQQQSLPVTLTDSAGNEVTVTQFNSQAMLTVDSEGNEGFLPISSLASYSLPSVVLTGFVNVYPSFIGKTVHKTIAKARQYANTDCLGQKEISIDVSELSA